MASTVDEDLCLITEPDDRSQLKELVRAEDQRDCHGGTPFVNIYQKYSAVPDSPPTPYQMLSCFVFPLFC